MSEQNKIFEPDTRPSKELRLLAAVSYVPFGFILPYMLGKANEDFVNFHVKQAFGMFGALIILSILLPVFFPALIYVCLAGFTGIQAYSGERFMFGFIRSIAQFIEKQSEEINKK